MKTNNVSTFILLIVLFLTTTDLTFGAKITWHTGQVEFWDHTLLSGDLSYNWAAEMVSIREPDGRIRTFSANQAARFRWFDYTLHKQRNFVSLVQALDKDRSSQAFYEIALDGPMTLVRRLRKPHGLLKRWFSHPVHANDQPGMAQDSDQFSYFVYDAGQFIDLNRFYQDIYTPLMTTYRQELYTFIQSHNINDRSLAGRIVLIDRYNWLAQHDSRAASVKGFVDAPK